MASDPAESPEPASPSLSVRKCPFLEVLPGIPYPHFCELDQRISALPFRILFFHILLPLAFRPLCLSRIDFNKRVLGTRTEIDCTLNLSYSVCTEVFHADRHAKNIAQSA